MTVKRIVDNYCPFCHSRDVVEVDKVGPSPSMSEGVQITFKCRKCKRSYITDYAVKN